MELTYQDAYDYIEGRCARYGMSLADGFTLTHPDVLANASPQELYDHWKGKQISHILSQETHPWLRGDVNNCFLEDAQENGERQENPATDDEIVDAWDDQVEDWIDKDYDDNGIPDIFETDVDIDIDDVIII